jgi:hypothetical protein
VILRLQNQNIFNEKIPGHIHIMASKTYLRSIGESANTATFYIKIVPKQVVVELLLREWWDFLDPHDANTIQTLLNDKKKNRATEVLYKVLTRFQQLHFLPFLPFKRKAKLLKEVNESDFFEPLRLSKDVPRNEIFRE